MTKIEKQDVTVRVLNSGAIECSAIQDGFRVHKTYYGYRKADAVRRFLHEANDQLLSI